MAALKAFRGRTTLDERLPFEIVTPLIIAFLVSKGRFRKSTATAMAVLSLRPVCSKIATSWASDRVSCLDGLTALVAAYLPAKNECLWQGARPSHLISVPSPRSQVWDAQCADTSTAS